MDGKIEDIFGAALSDREALEDAGGPDGAPSAPEAAETPTTEPMKALASAVMSWFVENRDHRRRTGVEDRLAAALDAQACRYSEKQRQKMQEAGISPSAYSPITSTKIRAAKSLLMDLVNQGGDPLFSIEPSPDPDAPEEIGAEAVKRSLEGVQRLFMQAAAAGIGQIPEEAMAKLQEAVVQAVDGSYDTVANERMQWARVRAKRMQRKVWDVMVEGGWEDAFRDYVNYICTYGTGLVVGPVARVVAKNRSVQEHAKDGTPKGARKYVREPRLIPTYEAVNPWDCYPAPDAVGVCDGPLCIRVRYTADELWMFVDSKAAKGERNGEGWNVGTVSSLLAKHPNGGVHLDADRNDQGRREAENGGVESDGDVKFEGVRCFASVRGSMLVDMGIVKNRDGARIEPKEYYLVESIVIGGYVVYCRIYDDRLGLPVSKGVFYELPGSWWGESVADKLAMVQYVQNNCVKCLLENMTVASGPQFWVSDVQRLVDKTPNALRMRSLKTWAFGSSMGMANTGAPMGVLSVPSNATELLNIFEKMRTQSDLDSGIPAFTEGQSQSQGGALRTASGLALYTEASTRGMKMVMSVTDSLVIRSVAKKTADWILVYGKDMDLKGDVEVRPVGLIGKILKAQRDQSRLQILQLVLNSQYLQQIIGPKGVIALFRPSVGDVDLNPDDVVPNEERMKEIELLQGIQEIFQATAASQGVQQNSAPQEGGGAPGIESPRQPGGVAQRQGVA